MSALAYERVPAEGVEFHEYANLFPWIEGKSFEELKADIAKNGVLEPIVFLGNAILDGRNRYMAARDLGVEYPRVQFEGDDPLAFVVAKNLARRHLSESQRAMVGTRLAKLAVGRPPENPPIGGIASSPIEQVTANNPADLPVIPTQAEAAEMLNVSERSIQRARVVEEEGIPELVAAVDAGEIKVSAAAEIARLPKEDQPAAVEEKIVNRTSFTGNNEWFTPQPHIERARAFLGGIDLDPASNAIAQETVKAEQFYTEQDNGLDKEWKGRIWLNPPYAQPAIGHFADKMVAEVKSGRITDAVMLTHNYTDTAWFQTLAKSASAICFTRGRVKFEGPNGEVAAPTQGQAFFYFGQRAGDFASAYADVGFVVGVHR